MNIIFLSNTGVHQALIAANIYLARLDRPDFRYVEGFCDTGRDRSGIPIHVGEDEQGNQVYTLGVGKDLLMAKKSLEDLRCILGKREQDLVVEPVSIRGQALLSLLSLWPKRWGGAYLNVYVSNHLLRRRYQEMEESVKKFQARLRSLH